MDEIKTTYFKLPFNSKTQLISGLPLPDPTKGPYRFINCVFHPGLEEELKNNYKHCEFVDCD